MGWVVCWYYQRVRGQKKGCMKVLEGYMPCKLIRGGKFRMEVVSRVLVLLGGRSLKFGMVLFVRDSMRVYALMP